MIQVKTTDWRKDPKPITRAKLGTEIAKSLELFIEVSLCDLYMHSSRTHGIRQGMQNETVKRSLRRWRVGEVGTGHINVDNVELVALERVSKGSWQPVFHLLNPAI